jgi:serine protease Do
MSAFIEVFQDAIIQIATPYSTGTGFYLKAHDIIVTNEHIVRDNREVVIKNRQFGQQLSRVLFTDEILDLAFLEAPGASALPEIPLRTAGLPDAGDTIYSIGHPYGYSFLAVEGQLVATDFQYEGIQYLLYQSEDEPGNNGGPLVDQSGAIIGVNTLDINEMGTSVPVSYLLEALEACSQTEGLVKARCQNCRQMVSEKSIKLEKFCPHCKSPVFLSIYSSPYEPGPVALTIEALLRDIGQDVRLSRRGPNNWEITQGSARIDITYHTNTGLIMGDAYLCQLPEENTLPIYEFLLKQNYGMEGLTFSIKDQDIVISLLIFDRYFNLDTASVQFQHLFEQADYFDNVLVEEFGAKWKRKIA